MWGAICCILGVIFFFVLEWIKEYNYLVALRNNCRKAFQDVEVQLRMRYDMIPMLVNCVKGYADHEQKTLDAVVKARNAGLRAKGVEQCFKAARRMDRSLTKLFALKESYPVLKADKSFINLQVEIGVMECYIAEARKVYNDAVRIYNNEVMSFPTRIIANYYGFRPNAIDIVPKEDRPTLRQPPKVEFD